ncbi:hypothetical protein SCACP_00830 [Sporomusa carbonis]|uniref:HD-GYP domain-containing protein n=1 Tax=Sporomusa carbonis TaxID=3076075 RepID=UPI003A73E192
MREITVLGLDAVLPGTVLAQDIISSQGKVLLAEGIELTARHIAQLRRWRIPSIEILSTGKKIADRNKFRVVYQHSVRIMNEAFETIRLFKTVPLDLLHELAHSHISSLINTHGIITHLKEIHRHCEYTFKHSVNVAIISGILGKWLGLPDTQLKELILAALMHDLGKAVIPLEILNKPGKLTDEEMAVVRSHSREGYQLLIKSKRISDDIKLGVLHHHERNDGSGYPLGLSDNQINYYAKIIAVVDTYDAMTAERVYRNRLTPFCAAETIEQQMFNKFDPEICLTFLNNVRDYLLYTKVMLSNGQVGEVVYLHGSSGTRPIVKLNDGSFLDLEKHKELSIVDVIGS